VTWYKSPVPEWLLDLLRAKYRFNDHLGRPENVYFAVGMIEAPDPESLGFVVGNPREFFMLSTDPMAILPFKVLGRREQK